MILDLLLPNENLTSTSSFERPNYHKHEAVISWLFTCLYCDWLGLFRVAPSLALRRCRRHPSVYPSIARASGAGRRTDGRRGSLLGPRRASLVDAAAAVRDRLEVVDAANVAVGGDGGTPALRPSKDGKISFCGLR